MEWDWDKSSGSRITCEILKTPSRKRVTYTLSDICSRYCDHILLKVCRAYSRPSLWTLSCDPSLYMLLIFQRQTEPQPIPERGILERSIQEAAVKKAEAGWWCCGRRWESHCILQFILHCTAENKGRLPSTSAAISSFQAVSHCHCSMIASVRGWLAVCQVKQKRTWNIVLLDTLKQMLTLVF